MRERMNRKRIKNCTFQSPYCNAGEQRAVFLKQLTNYIGAGKPPQGAMRSPAQGVNA